MITINEYYFEIKNTSLYLNYKFNEDKRVMRIDGFFKEYMLEHHKHNGINEINYDDFITGADAKYKLDDNYIIAFLKWYHKI